MRGGLFRPGPREREVMAAMSPSVRWIWPLAALLLAAPARAHPALPPVPAPARPASQQQLDRVEAQKRFALGVRREQESRFLEAVRAYEEAVRLDPAAQPAHVAL